MASKGHYKVRAAIEGAAPQTLIDALMVFTDSELDALSSFIAVETREFIGLGRVNDGGMMEKPADPAKSDALLVIEEFARREWEDGERTIVRDSLRNARAQADTLWERYEGEGR